MLQLLLGNLIAKKITAIDAATTFPLDPSNNHSNPACLVRNLSIFLYLISACHNYYHAHVLTIKTKCLLVGVDATDVTSVDPAHSGSVNELMTTTQSGSKLTITPAITRNGPLLTQPSKTATIVVRELELVSWSLARNVIWLTSVPKHLKMESDMWCFVAAQLGHALCICCMTLRFT